MQNRCMVIGYLAEGTCSPVECVYMYVYVHLRTDFFLVTLSYGNTGSDIQYSSFLFTFAWKLGTTDGPACVCVCRVNPIAM